MERFSDFSQPFFQPPALPKCSGLTQDAGVVPATPLPDPRVVITAGWTGPEVPRAWACVPGKSLWPDGLTPSHIPSLPPQRSRPLSPQSQCLGSSHRSASWKSDPPPYSPPRISHARCLRRQGQGKAWLLSLTLSITQSPVSFRFLDY